jgi:hypothetical protein
LTGSIVDEDGVGRGILRQNSSFISERCIAVNVSGLDVGNVFEVAFSSAPDVVRFVGMTQTVENIPIPTATTEEYEGVINSKEYKMLKQNSPHNYYWKKTSSDINTIIVYISDSSKENVNSVTYLEGEKMPLWEEETRNLYIDTSTTRLKSSNLVPNARSIYLDTRELSVGDQVKVTLSVNGNINPLYAGDSIDPQYLLLTGLEIDNYRPLRNLKTLYKDTVVPFEYLIDIQEIFTGSGVGPDTIAFWFTNDGTEPTITVGKV